MKPSLGLLATAVVLAVYGGVAISVDVPAAWGGQLVSDQATYYMIGDSLVTDGDLAYRQEDLFRYLNKIPSGPNGVFLKLGKTMAGAPDPDTARLFYAKSFIYPLAAAPFVWALGANGFLVFNALLLSLTFFCAYQFLALRSPPVVAVLLAGAFLFATVTPAYTFWIMPELFNFALAVIAMFLWLYKVVARDTPTPARGWLARPATDVAAALLLGVATFSKPSNLLLAGPMVCWYFWHREWRRALTLGTVVVAVAVAFFAINAAVTGEWNYQGGERNSFFGVDGKPFPFQTATAGFELGNESSRESLGVGTEYAPHVFFPNLRDNLGYFFVGRYGGMVAYFFPAVLALAALLLRPRRRAAWEWLIFAAVMAQMLFFIVQQPYTYMGSGGALGNRYFLPGYGAALFLLPAWRTPWLALLPWVVGSVFMGKILISPFYYSAHPSHAAKQGPLRALPPELTNTNDLPINTESNRVRVWYGGIDKDPRFQLYHFDDNAYLPEGDGSLWIRGESRAEMLIKSDLKFQLLSLTFTCGPVATTATVELAGRTQSVSVTPGAKTQIQMSLGEPFIYYRYDEPLYEWKISIASSTGFTPDSGDTRFLGVRVTPKIVR
ncbi:MAG TPA: hypothetical protein VFV98_17070 [Vicinamibacterales bacterium]|nr:hypothetical protein [Vicinamibacterales bacterium]